MPHPTANLDELPVVKGFRQRGLEMTRIETFTDAAFAFAITLLIIALGGEDVASIGDLKTAMIFIPGFAVATALIMVFWHGHHVWSRRFGLDDGATILLSILLVFVVMVYILPLRTMTAGMVLWVLTLMGIEPTANRDIIGSSAEVNQMFVIYGIGFAALSGVMVLLNLHAWRRREQLQLNAIERHETKGEIGAWLIVACVGLLSVLVALLGPKPELGVPGWVYMLLPIAMPIYGIRSNRRRDAMLAGSPG